jgi:hypothetical protein
MPEGKRQIWVATKRLKADVETEILWGLDGIHLAQERDQ